MANSHFRFTEAVSFSIDCDYQEEVDFDWSRLTADVGQESQCGWLKDKFGLSWQVNHHSRQADGPLGPREGEPCEAGDAVNEKNRYRRPAERF